MALNFSGFACDRAGGVSPERQNTPLGWIGQEEKLSQSSNLPDILPPLRPYAAQICRIPHINQLRHDLVESLVIDEYPGPDRSGFKETNKAYQAWVSSLKESAYVV